MLSLLILKFTSSSLLTYFEDKYQEMANSQNEEVRNLYISAKEILIYGEKNTEKEQQEYEMEEEAWAHQIAEEIKKEQEKDKQKHQV